MSVSEELVRLLQKEPMVIEFNLTTSIITRVHYTRTNTGTQSRHEIENRFYLSTHLSKDILLKVVHTFGGTVCDIYVYVCGSGNENTPEDKMQNIARIFNEKFEASTILSYAVKSVYNHCKFLERAAKENVAIIKLIEEGRTK